MSDATATGAETGPSNLAALLLEHPAGDDEALLHGPDRTWTAAEARDRVAELAAALDPLDPGEAVAVRLPDGPDVVLAMTAIWSRDAVFVPVNHRLPARRGRPDPRLGPTPPR